MNYIQFKHRHTTWLHSRSVPIGHRSLDYGICGIDTCDAYWENAVPWFVQASRYVPTSQPLTNSVFAPFIKSFFACRNSFTRRNATALSWHRCCCAVALQPSDTVGGWGRLGQSVLSRLRGGRVAERQRCRHRRQMRPMEPTPFPSHGLQQREIVRRGRSRKVAPQHGEMLPSDPQWPTEPLRAGALVHLEI